MRSIRLLSLLIALLTLTGTLASAGAMAEDPAPAQLPASSTPDNATEQLPTPENNTTPHLALALESHVYYPNDVVRAYIFNATDPAVSVIDPAGIVVNITAVRANDSAFTAEYALSQGIVLANFTVVATDNATGDSANDSFEVTERPVVASPSPNATVTPENGTAPQQYYLFVNVSQTDYTPPDKVEIAVTTNAGSPTVSVRDPTGNATGVDVKGAGGDTYAGTYRLDKAVVLGNYTVLACVNGEGAYGSATAYFNVTMQKSEEKGLRIRYAAYDPAQRAIVVRADAGQADDALSAVKNAPAMKGMGIKGVSVLEPSGAVTAAQKGAGEQVEIVIPVDSNNVDEIARQLNVTPDIARATTSVAVSADGTSIHLALNDKVDGCWYRLSAGIPAGYRVLGIRRADGTEIKNDVRIDRSTGEYLENEVNWYVDNGTLYFYDDPINGYDVALLPPAARASIAIETMEAGQISAIIYPFNQTDTPAAIESHDHLGRSNDNYANDIDAWAGTKTVLRWNNNVYSNDPMYDQFWSDGVDGEYVDHGKAVVGFNTLPDGSIESVIIDNFSLPSSASRDIDITQKVIIRDNNHWFATVYYIKNVGSSNVNGIRFSQGVDFNFNGINTQDNCYYVPANDTAYGMKSSSYPGQIQVGGLRSPVHSSAYDVNQYLAMWEDVAGNDFHTQQSYQGDGGAALGWDNGSLKPGDTFTIPVIWAVGNDTGDFWNTLNGAVNNNVYDVGIREIASPLSGDSLDTVTTPAVPINATAMDLGVTDQAPTVYLQIKNTAGAVVYSASKQVSLSVPYQESTPVNLSWSLTGVPAGTYNISIFTQLTGDQNRSNDLKSVIVNVRDFSLYPDQRAQANAGDNVLFPINLSNQGPARTFDIGVSRSAAGWATNLYYNNTSVPIARDTDGDGTWDWVNSSYASGGLPAVSVPASGKAVLLLQKLVPVTAEDGLADTVTLTAYPPGQPQVNSSAVLRTETPPAATVNKTFYLHGLYLNTTPETATSGSTAVTSVFYMWSQRPALADDFRIAGNSSVPIYYTSAASMPITLTLFYTDGASNSYLIGSNTSPVPASASQSSPSLFNFTVPTADNTAVPRGSYIVLKVDNQQTTPFNVWYTGAYRSRVDVTTSTYVNIRSIDTYDGMTPSSVFDQGDTVYVTGNVTDPIGAYDVVGATISITAPNGTLIVDNASMPLKGTDTASPALWKLYDYSLALDGPLPPGIYGINVTGYESNGVVDRKNASFMLASAKPAISMYPNGTRIAAPGAAVGFKHTVTNLNAYGDDTIDLACSAPAGWAASLYGPDGITPLPDTNADGVPDTGLLPPMGSTDVVVQVSVPAFAGPGSSGSVTLAGRSSRDGSVCSNVTDTVFLTTASVGKTLYLHDNGTQFLNTSGNASTNDHTDIARNGHASWAQTPAFARDFNVLDDPAATLYLSASDGNINVNVSLISSNATASAVLGSVPYKATVKSNTVTAVALNVPLSSYNLTIPRGNKLSLYVENKNTNLFNRLTVLQSAQYPSRLDMNTTSYVNVNGVTAYGAGGNVITSTTPPSTVRISANVSDPFGSFDVRGAEVKLLYPNNTVAIGPLAMGVGATDPGALSTWKRFDANLLLNASMDSGAYTIVATATESNGVVHSMSVPFTVAYPVNVSAVKSVAPAGGNDYRVTIVVTNRDNHTVSGVRAYDFFAGDFTVDGFSQPRTTAGVSGPMLQGTLNVFGPFRLSPGQSATITYMAHGIGNYQLRNMTIVGVDPRA